MRQKVSVLVFRCGWSRRHLRTSVCDVEVFARSVELHEVLQDRRLEELTVQLSDTVDLAATDDSEVAHADLLGEALFDERHAREPVAVAGELLFDRLEEDPSERVKVS